MNRKWLIAGLVAVVIGGYAIYAKFFLEHVEVGEMCKSSAVCDGQCLGFGELLPDYSHKEICTRSCSESSDCNELTECRTVQVIKSNNKGSRIEDESFCLPKAATATN